MKHFILCTLLALLPPLALQAQTSQHITINGVSVEKTALSITFDGDDAILHFADGTSQQADMAGVVVDFATATTITAYSLSGDVGDRLSLGGLPDGTPVSLYDASGRLIAVATLPAQPCDATSLRPGVYILKAGATVIKFNKK